MAMYWSQLIGTIVLIYYCSYLGGINVEFDPGLVAFAPEMEEGLILWTVPKKDKPYDLGSVDDKEIPSHGASTTKNVKISEPSQNLEEAKKEIFVTNTELPWYLLVPGIVLALAAEIVVMLACAKRKNRIRDEMPLQTYGQDWNTIPVRSKAGKKKSGSRSKKMKK